MTDSESAKTSQFFKAFPIAKVTYSFVIEESERVLNEVSEGKQSACYQIPQVLMWCKQELSILKEERDSEFYGKYKDCPELKSIEDSLERIIQRLEEEEKVRCTTYKAVIDKIEETVKQKKCKKPGSKTK